MRGKDWWALGWFVLLALALVGPALLPGKCLLAGDYALHFEPWRSEAVVRPGPEGFNSLLWDSMAQYYPWRLFAKRELASGVIPLWNPHTLCGEPFLANFQSAVFYPLNLFFWLFDPARIFGWLALLHLVIAGLGAYFLLRALGANRAAALAAGTAYELSGFLVTWLELPTLVYVASWIPWAVTCAYLAARYGKTRWWIWLGVVLGLQGVAGHPQIWLYSIFAVVAVALGTKPEGKASWWRRLVGLAGAGAGGGLLAAVQVVPAMEFARWSHRASAATIARFASYRAFGLPSQQLVTLVLPDFFGRPDKGTYWGLGNLRHPSLVTGMFSEYCVFIGVTTLVLAVVGVSAWRTRRTWALAVAAVVLLLLACGTWLNAPLFFLVPGMASSGGPNRIVVLLMLVLAVLAGLGVEALVQRRARWQEVTLAAGGVAAFALVSGAYALLRCGQVVKDAAGVWLEADPHGMVAALLALAVVTALALAMLEVKRGRPAGWVFAVVIGVELVAFGHGYNPVCKREAVYPESAFVEQVKAIAGLGRVAVVPGNWRLDEFPKAVLPPNAALAYGLYSAGGYDSLLLKPTVKALEKLCGRSPFVATNGNMAYAPGRLEALKALGVKVQVLPGPEGQALFKIAKGEPVRALAKAKDGRVSRVSFGYPSCDQAEVEAPAGSEAILLSDSYCPGWEAWLVEGAEAEQLTIEADQLNRRVVQFNQPSGGKVKFVYRPVSYLLGLYLTLLGLAWLSGVLCATKRGEGE